MLKIGPMISSIINMQSGQAEQITADRISGKTGETIANTTQWIAMNTSAKAGAKIGALKQNIKTASKKFSERRNNHKNTNRTKNTAATNSEQRNDLPKKYG